MISIGGCNGFKRIGGALARIDRQLKVHMRELV